MYRFLLSRRWIGLAVFVVFWVVLCHFLGQWQFHRLHDRRANNALVRHALVTAPVPLDDVVIAKERVPDEKEWTRVTATGTFDTAHQFTVKYKSRDVGSGQGVDVVTPLVMGDGTAILVDRGWLDTGGADDPTSGPKNIPQPPAGEATVVGWLRPNDRAPRNAVTLYGGQVRAISAVGVRTKLPYRLRDGYLNLRSSTPPATSKLLKEPVPDLGEGPHLFYAIQWYFFGFLGVLGYFWFARNEARERSVSGSARASGSIGSPAETNSQIASP